MPLAILTMGSERILRVLVNLEHLEAVKNSGSVLRMSKAVGVAMEHFGCIHSRCRAFKDYLARRNGKASDSAMTSRAPGLPRFAGLRHAVPQLSHLC